jgi:single-strand DNA-binding protein
MARSLNKVELIGNLTRDPELRYTPQGTAVCTFGLATNRQWTTDSGDKKEDVEFHRIVAWQKLAELCAQLLSKGRKTYVEGRLQTRRWTGQDGQERQTTEIVISDMIILDSKYSSGGGEDFDIPEDMDEEGPEVSDEEEEKKPAKKAKKKKLKKKESRSKSKKTKSSEKKDDKDDDDDIPF